MKLLVRLRLNEISLRVVGLRRQCEKLLVQHLPSPAFNLIKRDCTDIGLKYPTDPSIGPSNISYFSVISLPDLNSMTPSARPFAFNVSRVLEHLSSFSSLIRIHPTINLRL